MSYVSLEIKKTKKKSLNKYHFKVTLHNVYLNLPLFCCICWSGCWLCNAGDCIKLIVGVGGISDGCCDWSIGDVSIFAYCCCQSEKKVDGLIYAPRWRFCWPDYEWVSMIKNNKTNNKAM